MPRFSFSIRGMMIVIAVIALGLGAWRYVSTADTVCVFRLDNKRTIKITRAMSWEISCPIYYEVFDGAKQTVPQYTFSYLQNFENLENRFKLRQVSKDVIAIEDSILQGTVVVHDFSNSKSFPFNAKTPEEILQSANEQP